MFSGLAWGGRLALTTALAVSAVAAPSAAATRLKIPRPTRQLVVVSSPTATPAGPQAIAELRGYSRPHAGGRWRPAFGPWPVETGSGHLVPAARRREGDHATPTGVFSFGRTLYGNQPNPGGLHYRYHHLVCGDWWDEDPSSPNYNQFVHVPCGMKPVFGGRSEALWTERLAYPYFAVVNFNTDPVRGGSGAPGSGIFVHSWVGAATAGCIAIQPARLLRLLRWLRPALRPMIEIGVTAQLAKLSG